eukprot:c8517_g1_i2.p1 GENE.c8517_g1_i2~~c8517_g1_i2.p1  ORF type:complete len:708 (+),score=208.44 c8517_g1_i2:25-2148(+)
MQDDGEVEAMHRSSLLTPRGMGFSRDLFERFADVVEEDENVPHFSPRIKKQTYPTVTPSQRLVSATKAAKGLVVGLVLVACVVLSVLIINGADSDDTTPQDSTEKVIETPISLSSSFSPSAEPSVSISTTPEASISPSTSFSSSISVTPSISVSPSPTSSPILPVFHQMGFAGVSTENDVCAHVGTRVLSEGGNAVDAAVATVFCLSVVHPFATSIGGDGIMTIATQSSVGGPYEYNTVDFRGTAPGILNLQELMRDRQLMRKGPKAVLVPTLVKGLFAAHSKWGLRPWASLIEPSINIAANGFVVTKQLAFHLKQHEDLILENSHFREVFATADRQIVQEGSTILWKAMEETLTNVANHPGTFYESDKFLQDLNELNVNAYLSANDMTRYTPMLRHPFEVPSSHSKIILPPLPSAATMIAIALNILDHAGWETHFTPLQTHKLIESFKLVFGKIPSFGEATTPALVAQIQKLLTPEEGAQLAAMISSNSTLPLSSYIQNFSEESTDMGAGMGAFMMGQAHVSVVDRERMAVSLSTSLGDAFGSGIMLSRTGVILNNGMAEFSLNPDCANFVDSNKRPLTFMSPLIVMKDNTDIEMVMGATGGSAIITSLIQTLASSIKFQKDIPDAIAEPRVHHQLQPDTVLLESSISPLLKRYLERLGHEVSWEWTNVLPTFPHLGFVKAVKFEEAGVMVATDPRTEVTSSAIIR